MKPLAQDRGAVAVRAFNRFYTQKIGVLREKLVDSEFSLTEVRVLYELAHRDGTSATDLARDLGLDPGYLSRILRAFERKALIARRVSAADARRQTLALTAKGKRALGPLEARAHAEAAALLAPLTPANRQRVLDALATTQSLLSGTAPAEVPYVLRPPHSGDLGWIVHRHGALYAREHGWDERFEALVARIAADFLAQFKPRRERCWIAERHGEIVGSVIVVERSKTAAQLRLLLVEPQARGLGIGECLVQECIAFSRSAGYRTLMLWTNAGLDAARGVYEKHGFRLVLEEPQALFGEGLIGQSWELDLRSEAAPARAVRKRAPRR